MPTQTATQEPENTNAAPPAEDLGALSVEELQKLLTDRLEASWLGFERQVKTAVAPLLFHLRLRLKKPGSRTGGGFGKWCDANLPVSRRTADRWADDYAESIGRPTSSQQTKGAKKKGQKSKARRTANGKDDGAQHTLQLATLTSEQRDAFDKAVEALKAAQEDPALICLNALVQAAAKLASAPKPPATENRVQATPKKPAGSVHANKGHAAKKVVLN